jgi:phenylacetate-CoA ligase
LTPIDWILELVGPRYRLYVWFFRLMPPGLVSRLGYLRALRAAELARRRVPAYREFLTERGIGGSHVAEFDVPETDKSSYIKRYSMEDRCLRGRLPRLATTIDESSGSTGTPHNWIRSNEERHATHIFISHFARYCYGDDPWITINAFSMGAWATGVNMGVALQSRSIVKCTGPDVDKVLRTIDVLGTGPRYLVCGYPPFLKRLVDESQSRGFPLGDYRLMALLGGEGNSEGLRDYLSPWFAPIYSGYGATDLEIGIGGETPISLAIRRLAYGNAGARKLLFGDDSRLPMVFQYNPLMHHVEVNESGELVFTISRKNILSPRIRYNIHDAGGLASYPAMLERLRSLGIEQEDLVVGAARQPLRLPFMWLYGRKDSTVSVMGANIYPEDVEQCLYAVPKLAAVTHSFMLLAREDVDGGTRPVFAFEVNEPLPDAEKEQVAAALIENLHNLNTDFRQAMEEYESAVRPVIEFCMRGEGPFAQDEGKIKQTRIITTSAVR